MTATTQTASHTPITHFVKRTALDGTINISAILEDGGEAVVACFYPSHGGDIAYAAFVAGLAPASSSWKLFDRDHGQWVIGTVGELVA